MCCSLHVDHDSQAKFVFANWMVPSLIRNRFLSHQAELAGLAALHANSFMGVWLPPVHSYQRGQLYMQEAQVAKTLAQQRLNLDHSIVIMRSCRPDQRDGRPRDIAAKVLMSNNLPSSEDAPPAWKASEIVKTSRIAESEMIKTSDMVLLDGTSEDSLPSAISGLDSSHRGNLLKGAKRYEQLGVETCGKILDAALDGLQPTEDTPAVVVIDTNAGTGEMLEAFFIKRLAFHQLPLFYYGVAPDLETVEQIESIRLERLALQVLHLPFFKNLKPFFCEL